MEGRVGWLAAGTVARGTGGGGATWSAGHGEPLSSSFVVLALIVSWWVMWADMIRAHMIRPNQQRELAQAFVV